MGTPPLCQTPSGHPRTSSASRPHRGGRAQGSEWEVKETRSPQWLVCTKGAPTDREKVALCTPGQSNMLAKPSCTRARVARVTTAERPRGPLTAAGTHLCFFSGTEGTCAEPRTEAEESLWLEGSNRPSPFTSQSGGATARLWLSRTGGGKWGTRLWLSHLPLVGSKRW